MTSDITLYEIGIVTYLLGVLSIASMNHRTIRLKKKIKVLTRTLEEREKEVNNLRNLPITSDLSLRPGRMPHEAGRRGGGKLKYSRSGLVSGGPPNQKLCLYHPDQPHPWRLVAVSSVTGKRSGSGPEERKSDKAFFKGRFYYILFPTTMTRRLRNSPVLPRSTPTRSENLVALGTSTDPKEILTGLSASVRDYFEAQYHEALKLRAH